LAAQGLRSVLLEKSAVPGGLIRSEHLEGVLYEPHGSHIFHTEDDEVWQLATSIVPFRPYRHRVDIMVAGLRLNWPPLLSEIVQLPDGDRIQRDLLERRSNPVEAERRAASANFEEWCLELMGPDLYRLFIEPYTTKQWGRPPSELPAVFAPRRVSVRYDDDPYLFPDRHQGWPAGPNGYTDLIDGLLDRQDLISVHTQTIVDQTNVESLARRYGTDRIVLTCPLDEFCAGHLGPLAWRGILVRSVYVPHLQLAQGAMTVNYPSLDFPFIRVHETKHASGQDCQGTVLGFEFTGADDRHYPIETGANRALNAGYKAALQSTAGMPLYFAGRLANYVYIDMDDCMREALDCADAILADAAAPTPT
jgi:UDP-galactopyranose mutase